MKLLVLALVLVTTFAWADYTKTAHIAATQNPRRYLDRGTQLIIDNLVYDSRDTCKEAAVGSDYPASVEGDHVKVLIGQKVCNYKVRGVTEVK